MMSWNIASQTLAPFELLLISEWGSAQGNLLFRVT